MPCRAVPCRAVRARRSDDARRPTVIDGFETLDLMEKVPVDASNDKPTSPIVIESVVIHANPIADQQ